MSEFNLKPRQETIVLIVLSVLLIAVTIGATISTLNGVKSAYSADKETEQVEFKSPHKEFGEIFEQDGMLCALFVARSYELRKANGITCLRNGNFLTIAPVVLHPDNQQELVGVQAKIRRHAIVNGGW